MNIQKPNNLIEFLTSFKDEATCQKYFEQVRFRNGQYCAHCGHTTIYRFKDGKRSYFRYNTLDLNPVGASDIAKDKDYANFFMAHMGYPTVRGKSFFSDEWCEAIGSKRNSHAAYRYAKILGFPLVVKPNSGTQGTDVALVHNKKDF